MSTPTSPPPSVLIVSGGFVSPRDRSLVSVLRRQVASVRASTAPWYDVEIKARVAAHVLAGRAWRRTRACRNAWYAPTVDRLADDTALFDAPELADAILGTLLAAEGVACASATVAQVMQGGDAAARLLAPHRVVFLSTTLLRDVSELAPVVAALAGAGRVVVAGGALAGLLPHGWPGCPGLDLLAVGEGETLVPALAAWIRQGAGEPVPPAGGRVERRGSLRVLWGPAPRGGSLDGLPAPDWAGTAARHGRAFRAVHAEAARGCPYRCAFCSYPALFGGGTLRRKSAARVAAEWLALADQGVEVVSCLDSLLTRPRARLLELCQRLVAAGAPLRWVAYARAEDLDDAELVGWMRRAGCMQVQIGVESGSQALLDAMDKRTTVGAQARGLVACHDAGIQTFVTVILGFPGETPETIRQTLAFLAHTRPDFAYATPFTARVEDTPALRPEGRARLGLRTFGGEASSSPYWRHPTMGCDEVGGWWTWFHRRLALDEISLDPSWLYGGMPGYDRARDRGALLAFQRDALARTRGPQAALAPVIAAARCALRRHMARTLP